jgi:hypothetical protein
LSADFLEGIEVHQGDPDLALDRRQHGDISHTPNYEGTEEKGYASWNLCPSEHDEWTKHRNAVGRAAGVRFGTPACFNACGFLAKAFYKLLFGL